MLSRVHMLGSMALADCHMYYGAPSESMFERVHALLSIKPGRAAPYFTTRERPSIFWTLDDNYHHVNPLNQAFLWNGYRTPDGSIVGRGDDVQIPLPDGEIVTLWRYGHEYFPGQKFLPEENRKRMLKMDGLLRKCDGVHFSSKPLERFYRKFARLKNTYVYPNSILFEDYNPLGFIKAVREDPEEVRMLWQGGSSHFGDLLSVRDGIEELCKRYPKLVWVIWGARFPWVDRRIPDKQFVELPWVPYSAYKPLLSVLDFDFAIAPLVPSPFNEGKSSIKFYEPAALVSPKPTLVARCSPYSEDLIEGETVLAYEPGNSKDFVEKASALIEDISLRKRIAARCHEWLRDERDALKTTPGLVNWMKETRESKASGLSQELADLVNSPFKNAGSKRSMLREVMQHGGNLLIRDEQLDRDEQQELQEAQGHRGAGDREPGGA